MLFLVIIGAATLIFVVAALFTSLTETPIRLTATAPVPLGTPEFRRAVESITGGAARPVGDIVTFSDGSAFLDDLLKEVRGATRSVTATNYIFREGKMTDEFFDALRAAAERGVLVRLLLDDHGADKAPSDLIDKMKAAGVKVARFRPISFRTITRIYRRTHVRAISIDGKESYMGGLAFDDEWLGDGVGEKEWRDLMFKFSGAPARAIQDQFNTLWRQTDGEILSGDAFYPPLAAPQAAPPGEDPYLVSLLHAPAPDISSDLLDLIWLTISGAKDHVYLATPYLTPPNEILAALAAAVERGVDVEVLVPGPYTDTTLVQSATRSYYEKLLKAGVKIYEYQPGRFHAKFLTADGHWSLVGSANMDNRSATLNVENVFGLEDASFAQTLEEEFAHDKANAEERTLENFRPNPLKKFYYWMVALFTKQF